jgi:uncharacterized membrane protein YvbJ
MNPDLCPHCGAEVPEQAKVCPECGSDAETGWSEKAKYDTLGIEYDDDFDHDEFVKREFGGKNAGERVNWAWVAIATVLTIVFIFLWLR